MFNSAYECTVEVRNATRWDRSFLPRIQIYFMLLTRSGTTPVARSASTAREKKASLEDVRIRCADGARAATAQTNSEV